MESWNKFGNFFLASFIFWKKQINYFKVEIATGDHPLNGSTELLALIKITTSKEPPKLDNTKFSGELCDLVERW